MSGGRWIYGHNNLFEAATDIEKMAARNPYDDDAETLAEFTRAVYVMRKAAIYWRRIDWLVSADDGPDSFKRRLREELQALEDGTFSVNIF